jgi:phosphoribosyl-ATP pyrophosphohydrolase/phosphoribosyl-AMP cyclohydrolase
VSLGTAPRTLDPDGIRYGADGLVATVVQDEGDGRVLMVAWQDAEAVEATLRTGFAHFHSRSRGRLWRKGETSGNVLEIRDAALDCDGDAILLTVRPTGPTCHTGARSCFDIEGAVGTTGADARPREATNAPERGFAWLETLWATIEERTRTRPEGSYTARLLDGGVNAVARKVAEEAIEVVLAARDDATEGRRDRDQSALAGEVADLLYHLLVLCAERDLDPREVIDALRSRHK